MSDKVLVGVDGSLAGQSALLWARAEARRRGAELVVVHAGTVTAAHDRSAPGESDYDTIVLQEAIATVVDSGGVLQMSTLLREDSPAEALTELSEDAELLVVGTHGLGRVVGGALGSVVFRLAGHARCPVAVVPERWADFQSQRGAVVVGVSFSASGQAAFHAGLAEARSRGVPLVALRATNRSDEAFDADRGRLGDLVDQAHESHPDVHVLAELVQDSPYDALRAASERAELLVLGRHGNSPRVDGLGPITAHVMHGLACPTLICGGDLALHSAPSRHLPRPTSNRW